MKNLLLSVFCIFSLFITHVYAYTCPSSGEVSVDLQKRGSGSVMVNKDGFTWQNVMGVYKGNIKEPKLSFDTVVIATEEDPAFTRCSYKDPSIVGYAILLQPRVHKIFKGVGPNWNLVPIKPRDPHKPARILGGRSGPQTLCKGETVKSCVFEESR